MYRFAIKYCLALLVIAGTPSLCLGIDPPGRPEPGASLNVRITPNAPAQPVAGRQLQRVKIKRRRASFVLSRGGRPYFIKGIAGRGFLDTAAATGANSIRTWGSQDAKALLDRAQELNMTVTLGIWLSHHPSDYVDPVYKNHKINEIQTLVQQFKRHPALLIWCLGNEINLDDKDTPAAWEFVNDLARMIKALDANHPVITAIACNPTTLNRIAASVPNLDAVGINAYGKIDSLRAMVDSSNYKGPYLITEWGVDGHWEAALTSWGRPIEQTSAQKADNQLRRYANAIVANRDRCLGSYVFLWGQKQERTPTWYSMILEGLPGEKAGRDFSPMVDAMHFNWTGSWPPNRAPQVFNMWINDISAENNIILSPGESIVSRVEAGDPDNDPLTFIWELLEEPKTLSIGGSDEARPKALASVRQDNLSLFELRAPATDGEYRLFVYVLDHKGHVGTANIPFQVRMDLDQKARNLRRPS